MFILRQLFDSFYIINRIEIHTIIFYFKLWNCC